MNKEIGFRLQHTVYNVDNICTSYNVHSVLYFLDSSLRELIGPTA